jgi:hypothetical protein
MDRNHGWVSKMFMFKLDFWPSPWRNMADVDEELELPR